MKWDYVPFGFRLKEPAVPCGKGITRHEDIIPRGKLLQLEAFPMALWLFDKQGEVFTLNVSMYIKFVLYNG